MAIKTWRPAAVQFLMLYQLHVLPRVADAINFIQKTVRSKENAVGHNRKQKYYRQMTISKTNAWYDFSSTIIQSGIGMQLNLCRFRELHKGAWHFNVYIKMVPTEIVFLLWSTGGEIALYMNDSIKVQSFVLFYTTHLHCDFSSVFYITHTRFF